MELEEVEHFDWLLMDSIFEYRRHFEELNAQIMFVDEMPPKLVAIYDTNATEVTEQILLQTIITAVPPANDPSSEVGRRIPIRMHVITQDWTATDEDGRIWPIDHILADGCFTTIETAHPIERHRYKGGGREYAVASAEAPIGDQAGKLVIVRNEDESSSVYWTPDKHGLAQTQD